MQKLKITILILILGVLIIIPLTAQAGTNYTTNVKVYVDGNAINFSNTYGYPIIKDNRTFLPVRVTAEAMNAVVNWLPPSNVETKITGRTVLMTIGSASYTVNGVTNQMDVAPFLDESINRTYVPARFIADGLGYAMEWRQVNGVDYVFNFTKGQTAAERTAIMDKIAPVPVVTPVDSSRTIGPNDSMFRISYNLAAIGVKMGIIDIHSKDATKGYRWVCVNYPGMNTFHTTKYPTGEPVTLDQSQGAYPDFSIFGKGYDTTVTAGMLLTYNVYDMQNNLVRTVDFQL